MKELRSSFVGLVFCTPSYEGSKPVYGTHNLRGTHGMQVQRPCALFRRSPVSLPNLLPANKLPGSVKRPTGMPYPRNPNPVIIIIVINFLVITLTCNVKPGIV